MSDKDMEKEKKERDGNPELENFLGVILLCVGLFLLSKQVTVRTGALNLGFLNFTPHLGLVVIPLIIGVMWYFFNPKSKMPKWIILIGILIILASIIMSTSFHFRATSLFDYLLVFVMCASGAGLILRSKFVK